MVIKKDGEKCACGNHGCFETYCSMRVLKAQIASKMNLKSITGLEAYDAIKSGREDIESIVEEFIDNLTIGFSNCINIFEPEAICIGGSFVHFEDLLLNKLTCKMKQENIQFNDSIPEIVTAKCGNDAGMIGATIKN